MEVKLAGILNITEDSFSDGGEYLDIEKAKKQCIYLKEMGADIIDIGAVSSNPYGKDVSIEEEKKRLQPIIEFALKNRIPISIDSWRLEVQKFCLQYEISYLNDVNGFPNPDIYPMLRDHQVNLIVMHQVHKGRVVKKEISSDQIIQKVKDFFDERLENLLKAGISKERIFIDPGMGFFLGTDPLNSFRVINAIPEIKKRYQLPIYISVSRKSFLGSVTNIKEPKQRDLVTLVCELELIRKGVDWIRTHNPKAIRDALKVLAWIQ